MSDCNELPIHPTTGLRAIGIGKRGPIWPVMGGSGEGDGNTGGEGNAGGEGGPETGPQDNGDGENPTETVEFWKTKAREQEKRAKDNAAAAKELEQLKEANKSDAEKAADRLSKAEAEVAGLPAKVAEALKGHLVARHQIDAEDAELFLTATEPELLLKQVDRLLGQPGKRRKNNNHVPNQGNADKSAEKDSSMREFARQLFGNDS